MRCAFSFLTMLMVLSSAAQNNNTDRKPLSLADSSLYMCVEDFFPISGRGLAITGKITSGKVKKGQKIYIKGLQKDSIMASVNGIEKYGSQPDEAIAGENIGLLFSSLSKDQLKRGMVITVAEFGIVNDTIEIEVKLLPKAAPINNGSSITIYMHCSDIYDCKAILPEGVTIKPGDTKRLKIKTSVPVFIIPGLAVALRNYGATTGTGKLITANN